MIFSNSFMSASDAPGGPAIMSSNALRVGTSISDTSVQYRSAHMSVMMRIFGMPARSLSFDMAKNFSTMGRTLPGLQYMMSRTMYIGGSSKLVNEGARSADDVGVDHRQQGSGAVGHRRQALGTAGSVSGR